MPLPLTRAACAALVLAGAGTAAAQTLSFEGIAPYPNQSVIPVLDYYNGGASGAGTVGPDLGVSFSPNATLLCLNTADVTCTNVSRAGLGDPASAFSAVYFPSGSGITLNRIEGFSGALTFVYVSAEGGGSVSAFSGLDGTGTLLGTLALPDTPLGCSAEFDATVCPFSPFAFPFAGTALSIVFTGATGSFALDDITFGVPIPEPQTWALMLGGLAALGAWRRRRAQG